MYPECMQKYSHLWFCFVLVFSSISCKDLQIGMLKVICPRSHNKLAAKLWLLIATYSKIQTRLLLWRFLSYLWNTVISQGVYFHDLHCHKIFLHILPPFLNAVLSKTSLMKTMCHNIAYEQRNKIPPHTKKYVIKVSIPCFVLVASTL